ncbi:hypothetical protein EVAR_100982_1 [Eumeta japonica]|uniref:Uncharacterized protein n=1 Tax=Eumeta variegata TaxID=151549 RepID=A0A4C1SP39_EUMVA|nr:hypothetical protein EVAR_100982_1 [Eumeta japonica]
MALAKDRRSWKKNEKTLTRAVYPHLRKIANTIHLIWHFLCCNDDTRSVLVHIVAYVFFLVVLPRPSDSANSAPAPAATIKTSKKEKWRPLEDVEELQNDDQRSTTTASDEDGSATTRSVRFMERPRNADRDGPVGPDSEPVAAAGQASDAETLTHRDYKTHRLETPLILTSQAPKTNSAVQQLFNSGRPPPPAIEPQLITSETLKAWDAGARPRSDEMAVRRVAERNALRCSLLRSEARKKQQPKQETTSLTERIRLLTCDVDDEPNEEKTTEGSSKQKNVEKPNIPTDKSNEKAFGSASSSSSSSAVDRRAATPPAAGPGRQPQEATKFLSTLAPLTACVGSAAHHEGFYYVPPSDRSTASAATNVDVHEHSDAPAPDVVAGARVGANDGDDSLAAFAKATAPRTDRLRQRYAQDSQPPSSDDEHDDYGVHYLLRRNLYARTALCLAGGFIGQAPRFVSDIPPLHLAFLMTRRISSSAHHSGHIRANVVSGGVVPSPGPEASRIELCHGRLWFQPKTKRRGIAVKQQLAASDDILQQMQDELSGGNAGNRGQPPTARLLGTRAPETPTPGHITQKLIYRIQDLKTEQALVPLGHQNLTTALSARARLRPHNS